ncbi:MAG: bile acid:sodium symporter family protein [Allosphingosinicella sp.]|uniref:bile acid:sodium symporter family protein n=1 Tax=Allosphingosinicella sp. TaxID=2823234 RepID=UPI00395ED1BB
MLGRLLPDRFVLWLIGAVALAVVAPVSSAPAAIADYITYAAIFALFFLHGARLPREALVAGFADVKLHAAILSVTYAVFPLIGLAMLWLMPSLLDPIIWTGILFLCCVPSTVQSSIAYTSMAGGNVAGAVAAAAFSNMAGVFLTPLLAGLLLDAQGAAISPSGIGRIFVLLFLPFILGHAMRPWIFPLIEKRPALTTGVDKGTILLAVYGAFSAAMVDRVFDQLPTAQLAILVGLCLLLLGLVLAAAVAIGRLGSFPSGSRDAILFCGSVKSIASGAPMAKVLFPSAAVAPVLLPLMLYHTLQLLVCASIAGALARKRGRES